MGKPCPKGPHYHRRFKHPVGTNLAIDELQRNYIALGMTRELETINTQLRHVQAMTRALKAMGGTVLLREDEFLTFLAQGADLLKHTPCELLHQGGSS